MTTSQWRRNVYFLIDKAKLYDTYLAYHTGKVQQVSGSAVRTRCTLPPMTTYVLDTWADTHHSEWILDWRGVYEAERVLVGCQVVSRTNTLLNISRELRVHHTRVPSVGWLLGEFGPPSQSWQSDRRGPADRHGLLYFGTGRGATAVPRLTNGRKDNCGGGGG